MKTKNFPERRRQRQLGALSALRINQQRALKDYEIARTKREIKVLEARTAVNLRGVRTKKVRVAR